MTLKKPLRAIDLAVHAGRKRQSAKTGFVHGDQALDLIPIYENFCFAFALFRQKTGESVLEGVQLIERLLAFQSEEGNFPVYLHEFPKCWDFHLSLKIAPILVHILRDFSTVVNADFRAKVQKALELAIIPPKSAAWEHRFLALKGVAPMVQSEDLVEWVISHQLLDKTASLPIPYHREFQLLCRPNMLQEGVAIQPQALEYALSEEQGFSERLKKDHLHQLHSAALFPLTSSCVIQEPLLRLDHPPALIWESDGLHSLVFSNGSWENASTLVVPLTQPVFPERGDLFEISAHVDIAANVSILVNGEKSLIFYLGDTVSIHTPNLQINLVFKKREGSGDFIGHISRGNRLNQIACKGLDAYTAYDWQIALRTLRRESAILEVECLSCEKSGCGLSDASLS